MLLYQKQERTFRFKLHLNVQLAKSDFNYTVETGDQSENLLFLYTSNILISFSSFILPKTIPNTTPAGHTDNLPCLVLAFRISQKTNKCNISRVVQPAGHWVNCFKSDMTEKQNLGLQV